MKSKLLFSSNFIIVSAIILIFISSCASGPRDYRDLGDSKFVLYEGISILKEQINSNIVGTINKLAIYGVLEEDGSTNTVYKTISNEITLAFSSDPERSYRIMERGALDQALQETQYNINQAIRDPRDIPQLGEFLAADAILVAEIALFDDYFRLSARILSTESGEIISSGAVNIVITDDLEALAHRDRSRTAGGEEFDHPGAGGPVRILIEELGESSSFVENLLYSIFDEIPDLEYTLDIVNTDQFRNFIVQSVMEPEAELNYHFFIGQHSNMGLFLLDPRVPRFSNHLPEENPYFSRDGDLKLVPITTISNLQLYYDSSEVPNPPETLSQLLEISSDYEDFDSNQYGLVFFGGSAHWFFPFLRSWDQELFENGEIALETNQLTQAFAQYQELHRSGTLYPIEDGDLQILDWEEMEEYFLNGQAGLIISGEWNYPRFKEYYEDDLGVAPLPINDATGIPMRGYFGILTAAMRPNLPEEYHPLLNEIGKLLQSPEIQAEILYSAGNLPVNREAYQIIDPSDIPEIEAIVKSYDGARPLPVHPAMVFGAMEIMNNAAAELVYSDISPESLAFSVIRQLEELNEEIRNLLER